MQCIPISVFLSHFGNRANGSPFPFDIKELIHLGLVSKEFYKEVSVSIAKAIDAEWSAVGSNMSELVLNSDITLKGVTIFSKLIHAATQTTCYRLKDSDILVEEVIKHERSKLNNTVKTITLLHDYFKSHHICDFQNSRVIYYILHRYLGMMFVNTQYIKVIGILGECVAGTTGGATIQKLLNSNSCVPMETVIKMLQLLQDGQLDQLEVPRFPDYKTFRAHEAIWTIFITDKVQEHYNHIYTGIYCYYLLMCEAVILQVLQFENIWIVRKKLLHDKFEGLYQRAISVSSVQSTYSTELRNVATRVRACMQQADI
jgi:hypothetical protein